MKTNKIKLVLILSLLSMTACKKKLKEMTGDFHASEFKSKERIITTTAAGTKDTIDIQYISIGQITLKKYNHGASATVKSGETYHKIFFSKNGDWSNNTLLTFSSNNPVTATQQTDSTVDITNKGKWKFYDKKKDKITITILSTTTTTKNALTGGEVTQNRSFADGINVLNWNLDGLNKSQFTYSQIDDYSISYTEGGTTETKTIKASDRSGLYDRIH